MVHEHRVYVTFSPVSNCFLYLNKLQSLYEWTIHQHSLYNTNLVFHRWGQIEFFLTFLWAVSAVNWYFVPRSVHSSPRSVNFALIGVFLNMQCDPTIGKKLICCEWFGRILFMLDLLSSAEHYPYIRVPSIGSNWNVCFFWHILWAVSALNWHFAPRSVHPSPRSVDFALIGVFLNMQCDPKMGKNVFVVSDLEQFCLCWTYHQVRIVISWKNDRSPKYFKNSTISGLKKRKQKGHDMWLCQN